MERSPPSEIKLNGKTSTFSTHKIKLNQDGLNTIELKWSSTLQSLEMMFADCQDIEWVDFSNFDFSAVIFINMMCFQDRKLKYINFGNHDFTNIRRMNEMFEGCSALETVDNLGKATSSLQEIHYIFRYCSSLKSLNLTNLYTPSLTKMYSAFQGCSSLETIELPNFDNSQLEEGERDPNSNYHIFTGCNNLKYINLLNYKPLLKDGQNITFLHFIDENVRNNLIVCSRSFDPTTVSQSITNLCCEEPLIL